MRKSSDSHSSTIKTRCLPPKRPKSKKTCYLRKGVIKKEAPAAIQTKRRRSDTRKTRKERKAQAAKTAVEMMSKGELGMQRLPRWKSNTIGRETRSQNATH